MSTNIREWLKASQEEHDEAPVIVQDGDTPKEDFSTATNEDSGEADTDKPATAEIDAASDDADKGKDIDQGHQEVHVPDNDGKVSNEDASEETPTAEAEAPAEETPATEEHAEKAEPTAGEEAPAVEEHVEETQEETVSQEENVTEESGDKKDDIDAEDEHGQPKAPEEKEVIDPEDQTDAKVEEPVVAKLEENEAGDEQKTPESDEQVDPDPKGTKTEEVSSEVHHEAVKQDDVPPSPEVATPAETEEEGATASDETDVTPLPEEAPEDDVSDDLAAVAKVEGDIDHFNRVSESLERYYDILSRGMEEHDGIHGETAEAIRIGLENLDPMFVEEETIPAMEAFGQVSSRHTATYISMESLSSKMKSVVEATKRAIAKLFEMLYELWTKVTGGASRAKSRLNKLTERMADLKGDASVQTSISGSARLNIGSQFMGNDPRGVAAIEDIAEYIYNDYPKIATGLADDTAKLFEGFRRQRGRFGPDADIQAINIELMKAVDEFPGIVKKHLQRLPNQSEAATNELPSSLRKSVGVVRSHRVPGDYAVVQHLTPKANQAHGSTGEGVASMLRFSDIFNVGFVKLESKSGAQGGKETYRVPSIREMNDIAKRMEAVLKLAEKADTNKDAYKRAKKRLDEANEAIAENFYSLPKFLNPLTHGLNNMARILTQPGGQFNGYVIATLNAFMAVMEHNIVLLEKEVGTKSGKTVKGKAEEARASSQPALAAS